MTDKKKTTVKNVAKQENNNGIAEQLAIALVIFKEKVGEKKFKSILKKTTKQITEGIAKAEKKKKKTVIVKKKLVPKKAVAKKAVVKKVIVKKAK